jgi:hypothetical protein
VVLLTIDNETKGGKRKCRRGINAAPLTAPLSLSLSSLEEREREEDI